MPWCASRAARAGCMASSRVAHGRKNGLRVEVHGSKGTLWLDNERMNELNLYVAEGPAEGRGFRRILSAPVHGDYARLCPAPGHGLGFNELKVIELAELLKAVRGAPSRAVDFAEGLRISARSTLSPARRKAAAGCGPPQFRGSEDSRHLFSRSELCYRAVAYCQGDGTCAFRSFYWPPFWRRLLVRGLTPRRPRRRRRAVLGGSAGEVIVPPAARARAGSAVAGSIGAPWPFRARMPSRRAACSER